MANFQSSGIGNIPVLRDRLNTSRSDSVIVSPVCFISLVEILSRPVDFPFAYFVFLLSDHNLICYAWAYGPNLVCGGRGAQY